MKKMLFVSVLATALALSGAAAQEAMSVDQLVEHAIGNNLDLDAAYDALRDAEEELGWKSELASSRVSVSGNYGYTPDRVGDVHSLSSQVSLSVPITRQVSVSGSVSSRQTGSIAVSLSPFAEGQGDYRDRQVYARALAQAEYQRTKLPFDVESAAFGVLKARTNQRIAEDELALEERSYAISEETYELGELSYEELEEERANLLSARQGAFDAERGVLSAELALYRLLGPFDGDLAVAEVTLEEVTALLAEREAELKERSRREAGSMSLSTLRTDLEALQAELKATWAYRPSLSISASVSYPLSASTGVSLSFSPGDLQGEERADLVADVEETQQEIEIEQLNVAYQERMLQRALEISKQIVETRATEVEQASTTVAEAELLYEQGERTDIELERSRLTLETARMRLFSAYVDCIDAVNDLLLLHVL